MITKELIKEGIRENLVKFVVDPNMESGTVCQIGDSWFYFGGMTAEEINPSEYLRDMSEDDIVEVIFSTLEDFRKDKYAKDEYDYYEAVLLESIN